MSVRVNLRGMLRLIRVDTLRRVHNVGFLAERLNYYYVNYSGGTVTTLLIFYADVQMHLAILFYLDKHVHIANTAARVTFDFT